MAEHLDALRSHASGETVLPRRVALLTNYIAPYFLPVLRVLSDSLQDFQVFVSTTEEKGRPWEAKWEGVNVTVQRSLTTQNSHKFKEGFTERFERHFPYDTLPLLFRYRPDAIVSAQLGFRTIQAAIYRLINPSCRLVIWADLSVHTEREIGRARSLIRRFLLKAADAVLVTGKSGFEYIQRIGVPKERIYIAPYVTDVPLFQSASLAKADQVARRLLYAGQIIERKGLEQFLKALSEWGESHKNKMVEMWFVGDGPLRNTLEAFPAPSNVMLRFFGNVPYDKIQKYFECAGIFVLPTLADTWALVVNEALASGLPVLGSRYSQAVEELVQDGTNGWTFHPDNPTELREALTAALECPVSRLRELSTAARELSAHLTPAYSARCFLRAIAPTTSFQDHSEAFAHE